MRLHSELSREVICLEKMADRPLGIENMSVSSDATASQHNLKDNGREENDLRGNQSNPKVDAPKKKTTFKITSVTKSSQRGGSGDLTQDNDLDSQDDLDETVDSHTEDLSSEIYDTNSKATDTDNQDPLLTPEEVIKEKPARFKVVKVETKEPFKRGRWFCYDYLDAPEKSENKQEEIHVNSGNSSAANSVHYVHGVDDPSKNPLLAGATGTMPSQPQSTAAPDGSTPTKTQGEAFQPIQPASSSQPGLTSVSQVNSSFSNHVAQSLAPLPYAALAGVPGQSMGQSVPAASSQSLRSGGSVPNLPAMPHGQTQTSQSLSGNIPYPSGQSQQLPTPQGSMIPANVHSQPASVPGSVATSQQTPSGAMQTGEYVNSAGQGHVSGGQVQQVAPPQQQPQAMYDMASQQAGYNLNTGAVSSASTMGGNIPNILPPQQNHLPVSVASQSLDGHGSDVDLQSSLSGSALNNLVPLRSERGEDTSPSLGAGLAPLEIAVGGITHPPTDDDITEEA